MTKRRVGLIVEGAPARSTSLRFFTFRMDAEIVMQLEPLSSILPRKNTSVQSPLASLRPRSARTSLWVTSILGYTKRTRNFWWKSEERRGMRRSPACHSYPQSTTEAQRRPGNAFMTSLSNGSLSTGSPLVLLKYSINGQSMIIVLGCFDSCTGRV